MMARSAVSAVSSGTLWMLAVAAITRSMARRRGWPPRSVTAAASRPHSRATAASTGSGSNVASITPRRCARRARSSGPVATSTPKCNSAREATLMAASASGGSPRLSGRRCRVVRGSRERVDQRTGKELEVLVERPRRRRPNTVLSAGPLTQERRAAGPSSATGLPATVIVKRSPASARRSTSPTLLRSSFWGIVITNTR